MRKIEEVIDEVLKAIPKGNNLLRTDLEKIKRDIGYRPPEDINRSWSEFVIVLNRYLPLPPVEEWHEEIAEIMSGGGNNESETDYS